MNAGQAATLVVSLIVASIALGGTLYNAWKQNRSASDLASLTSRLRVYEAERQVRFASLHAKRIEIVGELYRRLVETDMAYNEAMHGKDSVLHSVHPELVAAASERSTEFSCYFAIHRFWFDEALCAQIDDLIKTFRQGVTPLVVPDHVERDGQGAS